MRRAPSPATAGSSRAGGQAGRNVRAPAPRPRGRRRGRSGDVRAGGGQAVGEQAGEEQVARDGDPGAPAVRSRETASATVGDAAEAKAGSTADQPRPPTGRPAATAAQRRLPRRPAAASTTAVPGRRSVRRRRAAGVPEPPAEGVRAEHVGLHGMPACAAPCRPARAPRGCRPGCGTPRRAAAEPRRTARRARPRRRSAAARRGRGRPRAPRARVGPGVRRPAAPGWPHRQPATGCRARRPRAACAGHRSCHPRTACRSTTEPTTTTAGGCTSRSRASRAMSSRVPTVGPLRRQASRDSTMATGVSAGLAVPHQLGGRHAQPADTHQQHERALRRRQRRPVEACSWPETTVTCSGQPAVGDRDARGGGHGDRAGHARNDLDRRRRPPGRPAPPRRRGRGRTGRRP